MTFPGGGLWPWIPPARVGRGTACHPRSPLPRTCEGHAVAAGMSSCDDRGPSLPAPHALSGLSGPRPEKLAAGTCPPVPPSYGAEPEAESRGRWGLGSRLGLGGGRPAGSGCGLLGLRRDSWFVCSFIHRVWRCFHGSGSGPLDFRTAILVTCPRSHSGGDTKPEFSSPE